MMSNTGFLAVRGVGLAMLGAGLAVCEGPGLAVGQGPAGPVRRSRRGGRGYSRAARRSRPLPRGT
jgi:hypothetical protein